MSTVLPAACCGPAHALVVAAEPTSADQLRAELQIDHLEIDWCSDEYEALIRVGADKPGAIFLSSSAAMLTTTPAMTALRDRGDFPIIVGVGHASSTPVDALLGAGATACVPEPFRSVDIEPVLRRVAARSIDSKSDLVFGGFHMNRCAHTVTYLGQDVALSVKEHALLEFLLENEGRLVSHDAIVDAVWDGAVNGNTVSVHVARVRTKIGDTRSTGDIIQSVRGMGYRIASS